MDSPCQILANWCNIAMLRRLWPTGNLVVSAAMFRQLVQQSALSATFQGYGCQYKWSIFEWMEAFINDIISMCIKLQQIYISLSIPEAWLQTSLNQRTCPKTTIGNSLEAPKLHVHLCLMVLDDVWCAALWPVGCGGRDKDEFVVHP